MYLHFFYKIKWLTLKFNQNFTWLISHYVFQLVLEAVIICITKRSATSSLLFTRKNFFTNLHTKIFLLKRGKFENSRRALTSLQHFKKYYSGFWFWNDHDAEKLRHSFQGFLVKMPTFLWGWYFFTMHIL